jgi:hypothetical protein
MEISGKFFRVINDLLSETECLELIKQLDNKLEIVDRGIAIYDRSILKSDEWAKKIYDRIFNYIPEDLRYSFGINNHFRFAKYHKNGHFDLHQDGFNQDDKGRRTIFTINIFLNSEFKGGETDFLLDDRLTLAYRAIPKAGRGVIFDRNIWHRGNYVDNLENKECYKYLLRTDVVI